VVQVRRAGRPAHPRYTGRQVWNKQRRDEVLLDVEDVAAGHQTKLRWNDRSDWISSAEPTHEALVSGEDYAAVQEQTAPGMHRPTPMKGRTTGRSYVLSGLVRCAVCGRRMEGTYVHETARYRCKYPSEYALANKVEYPKTVYVREESIVPPLDSWIAGLFDPANLDATYEALAMAGSADDAGEARREAARRKMADCDQRLAKDRKVLDAGADPAVVAGWMAEVQGERLRDERELQAATPGERLSKAEIRRPVLALWDIASVLATADPKDKAEIYRELDVQVAYDPAKRLVSVTAGPCTTARVGGGTSSVVNRERSRLRSFHRGGLLGGRRVRAPVGSVASGCSRRLPPSRESSHPKGSELAPSPTLDARPVDCDGSERSRPMLVGAQSNSWPSRAQIAGPP
jgi:site-specific DNA recombinase